MRVRIRWFFTLPLVALPSLTSSCDRNGNPLQGVNPALIDSVAVSPPTANIIADYSAAFSARTYFRRDNNVIAGNVTWSSSNPSVATVDSAGVVTGHLAGTAEIKATYNPDHSAVGTAVVDVGLLYVVVSPSAVGLQVEQTQTLACAVSAPNGFTVPQHLVDWQVADAPIATVNSNSGLVRAVSPGTTTVTCEVFEHPRYIDHATVTVTQAPPVFTMAVFPDFLRFEVGDFTTLGVLFYLNGNLTSPQPHLFNSSDNTIVTIDANGTAKALRPGTAEINVIFGGSLRGGLAAVTVPITVPVTVLAATTPSIVISPNPANIAVAGTVPLSVTVSGAAPTNPVGWFSPDPGVATVVANTGVVTGVAGGATVIRGTVTVNVSGGTTIYSRATVVNVTAPTQNCAPSGTYSFTRVVEFDETNSQNVFIAMPDPLPLTFTITGTSFTVTGPAPFIGGTGTINAGCNISMTAIGTVLGIPNVNVILSGALPAAGATRLVYQMGGNGSLPRGFPVYYRLTK